MKKDWVIWVGCISLFCTGAIWGMIPDKTGFFVVDNVHDLFEIFGAVATVITAAAALIALSAWRKQFLFAEKYRAIRDFHQACQSAGEGYWYVSLGFSLLDDVWDNREVDGWFWGKTEAARKAWTNADAALYGAYIILQHHLSLEEQAELSTSYWQFIEQVRSGGSEIIAFSTRIFALREKPTDLWEDYFLKGQARLDLISDVQSNICKKADDLLAKYSRPE